MEYRSLLLPLLFAAPSAFAQIDGNEANYQSTRVALAAVDAKIQKLDAELPQVNGPARQVLLRDRLNLAAIDTQLRGNLDRLRALRSDAVPAAEHDLTDAGKEVLLTMQDGSMTLGSIDFLDPKTQTYQVGFVRADSHGARHRQVTAVTRTQFYFPAADELVRGQRVMAADGLRGSVMGTFENNQVAVDVGGSVKVYARGALNSELRDGRVGTVVRGFTVAAIFEDGTVIMTKERGLARFILRRSEPVITKVGRLSDWGL